MRKNGESDEYLEMDGKAVQFDTLDKRVEFEAVL